MRRIIIAIITSLITFIITTFIVSLIIINSGKILKSFNIISVENVSTKYNIKFERVKAAEYYEIIVYDKNNSLFFTKKTYDTANTLNLSNIEYNQKYKLVVFAFNKLGDSISVNNPYSFRYTEPTFSKDNNLVLTNNEDYKLKIDGNLKTKNYKIAIYDNNYKIKEDKINTNEYTIPQKLFTDLEQKLDVRLYEGTNLINKINLYSNLSPISDIVITSPTNGNILDYNDVTLTYDGGHNADKYTLQIIKDNDVIKEKTIYKNRCVISSNFFDKAESYTLKVNASYKDYSSYMKTTSVTFSMNEKETLKPAYINTYYKYVKEGTKLTLTNPNPDGNIYYTIDGTDPNVNGILYKEPLTITHNLELKSVVKADKKNNSVISDYNINVGVKNEYRVYLSPSNQDGNLGVKSVGYTNEEHEMNDLANYIQAKLKEYNVKIYRNNPNGNINLWNSESMFYNCDLHLAIHSNASESHTVYGIETWINEQTSETYSLANLLQASLMSIYYKSDNLGNRGVKYANGSLGEVNDSYVKFGILIETAHHDYPDDAKWIMENKKLIGDTIANTILKYFGII
jgi:N-acetylmuramoyl-L-alanine amidase